MASVDGTAVPMLAPPSFVEKEDLNLVIGSVAGSSPPAAAGASGGITYRMRATDDTLGYPVYWESSSIDSGGADYSGPGPLSDVVVAETIGVP